jgi:hypothetical protein
VNSLQQQHKVRLRGLAGEISAPPERMNSPLETREVRLRELGV